MLDCANAINMSTKLFILFACFYGILALDDLPDYLREYACRKSDPNYNECLKKNIEEVRSYFMNGIKELNVPPLDPFELPYFSFNRTIPDTVDISMVITDLRMTGARDAVIQKVTSNLETRKGELSFLIPNLHLTLNYNVKGKVLGNTINMQGQLVGDFMDVAIATKGTAKVYQKEGVNYFAVDKFDIKFSLGDGKIKLTETDPKQQAMADFVTSIFNNNPRGIIESVAPVAIDQFKNLAKGYFNKILAVVPAEAYLPDRK